LPKWLPSAVDSASLALAAQTTACVGYIEVLRVRFMERAPRAGCVRSWVARAGLTRTDERRRAVRDLHQSVAAIVQGIVRLFGIARTLEVCAMAGGSPRTPGS
jgi:hypothetical protein